MTEKKGFRILPYKTVLKFCNGESATLYDKNLDTNEVPVFTEEYYFGVRGKQLQCDNQTYPVDGVKRCRWKKTICTQCPSP